MFQRILSGVVCTGITLAIASQYSGAVLSMDGKPLAGATIRVGTDSVHSGANGSTLQQRVARAGYSGWSSLGENVGAGFVSVDGVMAAWMGDAPHRDNLLGVRYTQVGFGEAAGANGVSYWTQDFGSGGTC